MRAPRRESRERVAHTNRPRPLLCIRGWPSRTVYPRQPEAPPVLGPGRQVHEAREVTVEADRDRVGRTIAVLGDDEVCLASTRAVFLVRALAVQQDDHVGILLERAGFAEV